MVYVAIIEFMGVIVNILIYWTIVLLDFYLFRGFSSSSDSAAPLDERKELLRFLLRKRSSFLLGFCIIN